MKRIKHHRNRRAPLSSMKELQTEKFRLQREIIETEQSINNDYSNLIDALTFRNIINTVAEEIIATNMVISQGWSIIRPLFDRKKKKKKVGAKSAEQIPKVQARRTTKRKQAPRKKAALKKTGEEIKTEE